jgi:hypothetical protein
LERGPRPIGVTLLAALELLMGVILVFGALGGAALGTLIAGEYGEVIGSMIMVIAAVGAVIEFIIGWGLLTGKKWARWVGIIFSALGVLSGLGSLPTGLAMIVIDGAVIYYLTRPNVIAWFDGRTNATESPPPPVPPTI